MKTLTRILFGSASLLALLSACSDLPEWMGGDEEKPSLQGTRVAVLTDIAAVVADSSLSGTVVTLPAVQNNADWQEQGGSASGLTGNLAFSGFTHHDSTSVGDGNSWKQLRTASPVVGGGSVFAMDSRGYITAHDAAHIETKKWTSKSLVEKDEPDVLGGGVAVEGSRVYATSGYGKVAAIDAATGKELWNISLGIPLRNAPKASGDKLFVLSVDNQLFVLDAAKGTQLWNHRGITETVGFITAVSPSVKDTIVLAPYSSGELHALDTSSGQEIWSDTLILSRHTTATGGFSGIGGVPVIADDTVYAGDSGGFFAAIALLSGRRVWEQDIPTLNPPWVAGDFIYLLSDTDQLTCMLRADGRVKWTRQLPRYENEKKRKNPLVWRGPVMADGQLLLAGQHGEMLVISPKDGSTTKTVDIPDRIMDGPVVAGGKLYLMTMDGTLHAYY